MKQGPSDIDDAIRLKEENRLLKSMADGENFFACLLLKNVVTRTL